MLLRIPSKEPDLSAEFIRPFKVYIATVCQQEIAEFDDDLERFLKARAETANLKLQERSREVLLKCATYFFHQVAGCVTHDELDI